MTSPITAKTCEAWWILEAADLRGLPAPFVVKAYADRVELQVRTSDEFDRWVEALDVDPVVATLGGMVQRTATGELLEHPVSVSICEIAAVSA